jgi:uncharacterized repeat protein (TIGR03803 family)
MSSGPGRRAMITRAATERYPCRQSFLSMSANADAGTAYATVRRVALPVSWPFMIGYRAVARRLRQSLAEKSGNWGHSMRIGHWLRALFLAGASVLVATPLTAAIAEPAGNATSSIIQQTLYAFCPDGTCGDGSNPSAGLIMDGSGNLYGTTLYGGSYGQGTVFQLIPTGTGWSEKVLYSFCSQSACTDGSMPSGGLIMDSSGNLYGTTQYGGATHNGTAFQLTLTSNGWTQKLVYSFCQQSACADGSNPSGGLIIDSSGNLYGETPYGGTTGKGTVFQLTPTTNGWTPRVLYSFCQQSACADGSNPSGGLTIDSSGNLYGTTCCGGLATYSGTVFQLKPTGTGWKEEVLYKFCSPSGYGECTDGFGPLGGLLMDSSGNLYGTTFNGGFYHNDNIRCCPN